MKLEQINLGQTYFGTMLETIIVKRKGGYYSGYASKQTGRICEVEFRVDKVQNQTLWGNWIEICGKRKSVQNHFSIQLLDRVNIADQ